MLKKNILIFCLLSIVFNSFAEIKTPKFYSDHMVLQQNEVITIYGVANPSEKIKASFKNEVKNVEADENGNWSVNFKASKAGGPYSLELIGENTLKFSDVYVGEVWFCSGQSNMGWRLENSVNGAEELKNANYPEIKLLQVYRSMSNKHENDIVKGSWETCTPENAKGFSAVAYFFGRELYKKYQVPIGLINSSYGGTNVEAWMNESLFKDHPANMKIIAKMKTMNLNNAIKKYSNDNRSYGAYLDRHDLGTRWKWENNTTDYSSWKTFKLPSVWKKTDLKQTFGIVWVTKLFELTESQINNDIELSLSRIDNEDITYVNGKKIGSSRKKDLDRFYTIPKEVLKVGSNRITIKTKNLGSTGGFRGTANDLYLKVADRKISLAGTWNYRVGTPDSKVPPKREHPKYYPTSLYNAMVHPFFGYNIKGAIWYQGESNTKNPDEYAEFFPQMINDWRTEWNKEFPFLFVQLANLSDKSETWPAVREAQASALKLKDVAMVVAIDVGDDSNIHPINKQVVGKRLAMAAENIAYGDTKTSTSGPLLKGLTSKENKLIVTFDSPIVIKGDKNNINGFEVTDSKGKIYPAKAKYINVTTVEVFNEKVLKPAAARYLWKDAPGKVMIYNKEVLPAPPFKKETSQ